MSAAKQRRSRNAGGPERPSLAHAPAAAHAFGVQYAEVASQLDQALAEVDDMLAAFHEARKGKGLAQLDGAVQQVDVDRLGQTLKTLAAARQAIIAAYDAGGRRRPIGSSFLSNVREENQAYISPKRFSAVLGVQVNVLADLAGVHRNTLRNASSERIQSKLREMAKAISAAEALTGDLTAALYWYRNEPIGDYDHKTPAELVASGHVEAVLAYLHDLENGAAG